MPHTSLTEWVAEQHRGQLIKRTTEPYLNHLLRVAAMAGEYVILGFECGLCHDLLEKTTVTPQILQSCLFRYGYVQAEMIVGVVVELTNVYTRSDFPGLNKQSRKEKEAARLTTISPVAQTVKYADLYDNVRWMLAYDPDNAPDYLQRKKQLVTDMKNGNAVLRQEFLDFIEWL
jgi:(p)ppGpp synthase/HD superfamily hydrolase